MSRSASRFFQESKRAPAVTLQRAPGVQMSSAKSAPVCCVPPDRAKEDPPPAKIVSSLVPLTSRASSPATRRWADAAPVHCAETPHASEGTVCNRASVSVLRSAEMEEKV